MGSVKATRSGQTVVVTGASGGIGRATAMAFGARGAQVGLLARGEKGLSAAARDVENAADHPRRREYWVGGSTVGTLAANAIAPGLLDRYLARTGFDSQQTEHARPPDQPANLWKPADGSGGQDFGSHGIFDDRPTGRSVELWASQHHGLLGGTATAAVAAAAGVAARQLRRWRR